MAQFRSLTDLAETTQNALLPGLINPLINIDEAGAPIIANAVVTDRPTIKGNRVVDEGTAEYVGCDDTITPQAISGAPFTYDLETISTSFDACIKGQNLYSSFTDVVMSEMEGAVSRIGKRLSDDIIAGNGSTEISGLETQIVNTVAQATGGAGNFDLSDLDNLLDLVRTGGPKVFIGNQATVNLVKKELRAVSNGETFVGVQGTNMLKASYEGIPLLKSQYSTAGSIHLIDLDQFRLFLGISEDMSVGETVFSVVPVGALETKLRKRWHMYVQGASVLLNTRGAASLTSVA